MNPRWSHNRRIAACAAAVALALSATGTQAQITKPTDPGVMSFPNVRVISTPAKPAEASGTANMNGFRAFRDGTGGLTESPTPAQLEEIQALDKRAVRAKASDVSVKLIHAPTGAVGARLDESHMSHVLIRRGVLGQTEIACVDDNAEVVGFLSGRFTPRHEHAASRQEILK